MMRGWIRAAVAGAVLSGALAACGVPPSFTTRVVEGSVTRTLWDNGPYDARLDDIRGVERRIESIARLLGKNDNNALLSELRGIGAQCSETTNLTRCVINRRIVKEDCGRGQCSRTAREWTLTVSWKPRPGLVDLNVKLALRFNPTG